MIEKINVKRQGLTTQVETALQQNADLIKNFKRKHRVWKQSPLKLKIPWTKSMN